MYSSIKEHGNNCIHVNNPTVLLHDHVPVEFNASLHLRGGSPERHFESFPVAGSGAALGSGLVEQRLPHLGIPGPEAHLYLLRAVYDIHKLWRSKELTQTGRQ